MIAGLLVSGGGGAKRSVEILREDGSSCSLPDLPGDRSSHSQAAWLACGGAAPAARQIELSTKYGIFLNYIFLNYIFVDNSTGKPALPSPGEPGA